MVKGTSVIVSHGDENLDVGERGMIGAIDGSQKGDIKTTVWAVKGIQFGFSSPVIDGERIYQVDDGVPAARLRPRHRDASCGRTRWEWRRRRRSCSPTERSYVGTDSGKFFILRPHADKVEVLSEVELPVTTDDNAGQSQGTPEPVFGGAAVSRGRVFFASIGGVYAFGSKAREVAHRLRCRCPAVKGEGAPAWVQVAPTELVLKPGQRVTLHARLFDEQGRFLREEKGATWSLEGLKGTVVDGVFTVGIRGGGAGRPDQGDRRRS